MKSLVFEKVAIKSLRKQSLLVQMVTLFVKLELLNPCVSSL